MTRGITLLLFVACWICAMAPGRATAGDYVNCQSCATTPQGEVEKEAWNDVAGGAAFQQMAVTHGVTDRLQVSVYGQAYESRLGARTGEAFASNRLEAIYRFTQPGKLPVDVGMYVQCAKGDQFGAGQMGTRLILSRDLGSLNISMNLGMSRTSEPASTWGTEFAAAARYNLNSRTSFAVEYVKTADGNTALIHRVQVKLSDDVQVGVGAALTSEQPNRPLQFLGSLSVRM